MAGAVRRIAPEDRREGQSTAGMVREEAVATDGMWAGFVRTGAGMVSDWHHHGDWESAIYVIDGTMRFEFGAGGGESTDARPGDFIYVPRNAVHRELSTSEEEAHFVVVRAGSGQVVFNVEGPES
jgi:uncharacterized RmlC-like cupin family protein